MKRLIVITGDNYSLISDYFRSIDDNPKLVIYLFPESTFNKIQMRKEATSIISNIKVVEQVVTTQSIFLLRELYILSEESAIEGQKNSIEWVNVKESGPIISDNLDTIGELLTLQEELAQADRYMDIECKKNNLMNKYKYEIPS